MKNTIIVLVIIILIGGGIYYVTRDSSDIEIPNGETPGTSIGTETPDTITETVDKTKTVLGKSVSGNDIVAYHYGTGDKELLFVGGIHGGYEWNTVLVSYELMDYLKQNPEVIPQSVKVTVIPVLNPDGLAKVVGTTTRFVASNVSPSQATQISGRFNANDVDLNRNFDCDWKESGTWQSSKVSGGSAPFSEPESQALRDYVNNNKPVAAVAYYSAAGGVYSSSCGSSVSTETSALTKAYARAAGYPSYENFDSYSVTGDMTNWLAKESIPTTSVLLTNHQDVEWTKNLAGVKAVLQLYK